MKWTAGLVRIGCSAVFFWAGAAKTADPSGFRIAIERYELVPVWLAWALAAYLPWLEIIAAVALFIPRLRRGAELVLLLLTIVFAAAIISAWLRGLNINCGCFGAGAAEPPNYPWWLARDGVLLAALWWLRLQKLPPTTARATS